MSYCKHDVPLYPYKSNVFARKMLVQVAVLAAPRATSAQVLIFPWISLRLPKKLVALNAFSYWTKPLKTKNSLKHKQTSPSHPSSKASCASSSLVLPPLVPLPLVARRRSYRHFLSATLLLCLPPAVLLPLVLLFLCLSPAVLLPLVLLLSVLLPLVLLPLAACSMEHLGIMPLAAEFWAAVVVASSWELLLELCCCCLLLLLLVC